MKETICMNGTFTSHLLNHSSIKVRSLTPKV